MLVSQMEAQRVCVTSLRSHSLTAVQWEDGAIAFPALCVPHLFQKVLWKTRGLCGGATRKAGPILLEHAYPPSALAADLADTLWEPRMDQG